MSNAEIIAPEPTAETLARWARIDAMYADGQFDPKGPEQYTTAHFFAEARARREAVMAGPFA